MDEMLYVIIVTGRPEKQQNVLKTVAAYITDEPNEAVRLLHRAEAETGGTACINCAPLMRFGGPCFVPMEVERG